MKPRIRKGNSLVRRFRPSLLAWSVAACFAGTPAWALPTGAQVTAGSASFSQVGNSLTVANTPGAIINWNAFSIGALEAVRFDQQNSLSSVLNRVTGGSASAIHGTLSSNGRVFLINPNGILFGAGSRIDVNGLIASTLNISDQDFLAGKLNFQAGASAGALRNAGTLQSSPGGNIYLIAPDIENSGIVRAPGGEVLLAAGRQVSLVDGAHPDIQVVVSAPADKAVNLGEIAGGKVSVFGALLTQRGTVSADAVETDSAGRIVFRATKQLDIEAGSRTTANGPTGGTVVLQSAGDTYVRGMIEATGSQGQGGTVAALGERVAVLDQSVLDASGESGGGRVMVGGDFQGRNPDIQNAQITYFGPDATLKADARNLGAGGTVIVWADDTTRAFGRISARGGSDGGDGGFVEVSGKQALDFATSVDTRAPHGKAGTLLLDPTDIEIVGGNGMDSGGSWEASLWESGADTSTIYADSINSNLSYGSVVISSNSTYGGSGNISVSGATIYGSGDLTLAAYSANIYGGNIDISNSSITSTEGALTLLAGWNGGSFDDSGITSGSGTITVGNDSALTAATTMHLLAGSSISLAGNLAMLGEPQTNSVYLRSLGSIWQSGGAINAGTHEVTVMAEGSIAIGGSITNSNAPINLTSHDGGIVFLGGQGYIQTSNRATLVADGKIWADTSNGNTAYGAAIQANEVVLKAGGIHGEISYTIETPTGVTYLNIDAPALDLTNSYAGDYAFPHHGAFIYGVAYGGSLTLRDIDGDGHAISSPGFNAENHISAPTGLVIYGGIDAKHLNFSAPTITAETSIDSSGYEGSYLGFSNTSNVNLINALKVSADTIGWYFNTAATIGYGGQVDPANLGALASGKQIEASRFVFDSGANALSIGAINLPSNDVSFGGGTINVTGNISAGTDLSLKTSSLATNGHTLAANSIYISSAYGGTAAPLTIGYGGLIDPSATPLSASGSSGNFQANVFSFDGSSVNLATPLDFGSESVVVGMHASSSIAISSPLNVPYGGVVLTAPTLSLGSSINASDVQLKFNQSGLTVNTGASIIAHNPSTTAGSLYMGRYTLNDSNAFVIGSGGDIDPASLSAHGGGGTFQASSFTLGGKLNAYSPTSTPTTVSGAIDLPTSSLTLNPGSNGALSIGANVTANSLTLNNATIQSGAQVSSSTDIAATGNLTNHGGIAFGNATTASTFSVGGNFTQAGTGSLSLYASTPTQHDQVSITGAATLDGTLTVNGSPSVGAYPLLSAGTLSGTFASVTSSGVTTSAYDGNQFTLSVASSSAGDPSCTSGWYCWDGEGDANNNWSYGGGLNWTTYGSNNVLPPAGSNIKVGSGFTVSLDQNISIGTLQCSGTIQAGGYNLSVADLSLTDGGLFGAGGILSVSNSLAMDSASSASGFNAIDINQASGDLTVGNLATSWSGYFDGTSSGVISLTAAGNVEQLPGTSLGGSAVRAVAGTSGYGSVTLTNANPTGVIAGSVGANGGNFSYHSSNSILVAEVSSYGDGTANGITTGASGSYVQLSSLTGDIQQTAPIVTPGLAVSAPYEIWLDNGSNSVGTLAGISYNSSFHYGQTGSLTIGTVVSTEGISSAYSLELGAGTLTVNKNLNGTYVALTSNAGDIEQAAGTAINASGGLSINTYGGVTLPAIQANSLSVSATGAIDITDAGTGSDPLYIAHASSSGANSPITITTSVRGITVDGSGIAGTGAITLSSAGDLNQYYGTISNLGGSGNDITLHGNNINLNNVHSQRHVILNATGNVSINLPGAMNDYVDDDYFVYNLPFSFNFFGQSYSQAYISSNGLISFDSGNPGYSDSLTDLGYYKAIAPAWNDWQLTPLNGKNIFISQPSASQLAVKWNVERYYNSGQTATFESVLNSNGNINFNYGTANASFAGDVTIGLGAGNGTYLASQLMQETNFSLNNLKSTTFTPNGSTYDETVAGSGGNLISTSPLYSGTEGFGITGTSAALAAISAANNADITATGMISGNGGLSTVGTATLAAGNGIMLGGTLNNLTTLAASTTNSDVIITNHSAASPAALIVGSVSSTYGGVAIDNYGATTVTGPVTAYGGIALVAHSPLTINGTVSSTSGTIQLIAGDPTNPSGTDDLTINGTLSSQGGGITLAAGNSLAGSGTISVPAGQTVSYSAPATVTPVLTGNITSGGTATTLVYAPPSGGTTPPPPPPPPTVDACVANPSLPGCSTVLPTLDACVTNPSAPGCSAVLPTIDACVTNPTAPGCSSVLPTVDACVSNPTAPGCSAVLPTIDACVTSPTAPGCSAVLPTVTACVSNPAAPGCSAVLPTIGACVNNPTAPGCSAVLPPPTLPTDQQLACLLNPTACAPGDTPPPDTAQPIIQQVQSSEQQLVLNSLTGQSNTGRPDLNLQQTAAPSGTSGSGGGSSTSSPGPASSNGQTSSSSTQSAQSNGQGEGEAEGDGENERQGQNTQTTQQGANNAPPQRRFCN